MTRGRKKQRRCKEVVLSKVKQVGCNTRCVAAGITTICPKTQGKKEKEIYETKRRLLGKCNMCESQKEAIPDGNNNTPSTSRNETSWTPDFTKMTVKELKKEMTERDLKPKGFS